MKKSIKEYGKQFWHLLWKDESPKGWIFTLIFLFVFIKFIFFPILSLTTGTSLPLAIVESCSMYHEGNLISNFDGWWDYWNERYSDLGITKEEFQKFSFKKGFNKGDILFIVGAKPEKLKIGDVIIFNAAQQNPIIHRIIKVEKINNEYIFSTIGDHNSGQLPVEKKINENQLVGKAVFKVAPYIGWGKLIFFEYKKSKNERGFCKSNY
ncbi:MAG: signal peptidase I [Candidatus Pacearchaeota archaeon]